MCATHFPAAAADALSPPPGHMVWRVDEDVPPRCLLPHSFPPLQAPEAAAVHHRQQLEQVRRSSWVLPSCCVRRDAQASCAVPL